MSSPIFTIFDSFFAPLPNFKVHDEAVYRKASAAASTKDEEPLRALNWEESESILQYVRRYLRSTILEEDDILCQQAAIPLRQMTIKTEMDVTAQAILHLFYQVNHTINRHLQHGQVETSLDLVHRGGTIMGTDYRWTFQPYNGTPVPFAVLEMKAPNLLSREDFEKATARTAREGETEVCTSQLPG